MQEEALGPFGTRKGHFRFESGHPGDLWLAAAGLRGLIPVSFPPLEQNLIVGRVQPSPRLDRVMAVRSRRNVSQSVPYRMRRSFNSRLGPGKR